MIEILTEAGLDNVHGEEVDVSDFMTIATNKIVRKWIIEYH